MTNIVLLNSVTHRSVRVQAEAAAKLGDNQRFVQVVVAEFPFLITQYPILLSRDPAQNELICVAMLGIDEGENLFLADEGGHEGYRPLMQQRVPFYLAGDELAIDLDHCRVSQDAGAHLFDSSGQITPYLESIKIAFQLLKPSLSLTQRFIATLSQIDLIEPIDIVVSLNDDTQRTLQDYYTINRDKLQQLPDAAVLELFRQGELQLIHMLIASLKHIPLLVQRKNRKCSTSVA